MASCGPELCDYCGLAPCAGDRCPQWDQDDGPDCCTDCGRALGLSEDTLCRECGAMGGPCDWCGDVVEGYGRLCDRCDWETGQSVSDD